MGENVGPEDFEDAVTAGRRADAPGAVALPGAEERPCEECGEAVVINPATQQEIEAGHYPETVMCLQCATDEADADDEADREADGDAGGDADGEVGEGVADGAGDEAGEGGGGQ